MPVSLLHAKPGLMKLRHAVPADFHDVLALNEESVRFLSPMDLERLKIIAAEAEVFWVVELGGVICAFLIALREGATYDSVNYRWFAARYSRFLYVDRVVVAAAAQGQGMGALLYREAFAHAGLTDVPMVACEFDLDPPNPGSAAFHQRFGFAEVGQQWVASGEKAVSLQVSSTHIVQYE